MLQKAGTQGPVFSPFVPTKAAKAPAKPKFLLARLFLVLGCLSLPAHPSFFSSTGLLLQLLQPFPLNALRPSEGSKPTTLAPQSVTSSQRHPGVAGGELRKAEKVMGGQTEEVGLVSGKQRGRRERASGTESCPALPGHPCTCPRPSPPPCQPASYLPAFSGTSPPSPPHQTALGEARQMLSVSNGFHYKCSTIR